MVDEIKPVSKSWLVDRVRFGERYLRYNLADITNKKAFEGLAFVKNALNSERDLESTTDNKNNEETMSKDSQYENLDVSEEPPHDIDKLI